MISLGGASECAFFTGFQTVKPIYGLQVSVKTPEAVDKLLAFSRKMSKVFNPDT